MNGSDSDATAGVTSSSSPPSPSYPITMKAFAIPNPGDKEGKIVTLPVPTPGPNEALVKVLRAGVCNTDLEILQGYMGFSGVLGHEFVGRVVDVNTTKEDVRERWRDVRVCGDINVGCFACDVCRDARGLDVRCPNVSRNHCPHRTVLGILGKNGTMAEYLTLPVSNLHEVPDSMDDATAVFSEPLAAACRIVEQGLIRYDDDADRPDRVAVLGDGKLGLMIAEVMGREHARRTCGNDDAQRPVLFGKHEHKLDLVRDSGVDCRLVAECVDETSFSGVAKEHAARYDVVVDATGSPAGLKLAAGLCRPMGTLVLKSTCAAGEQFNAAPFVIDELKVVGSRCGPINTALELLSIGLNGHTDGDLPPLRVEKYVTKTFPLSRAVEAIKCAAERSTMKVQIICSE